MTEYSKPGFNNFRAYCKNGTLRAEAEVNVRLIGYKKQPYPDQHLVRDGKYYNPDGKLVSSITDGTGIQKYYSEAGQIYWMLELKEYKRIEHKMWHKGKLISHGRYQEDGTCNSILVKKE